MSKNPFLNALAATAYITVIASIPSFASNINLPEGGIIIPIFFLSLFVLSVALMGYFFVCQPIILLVEGKQKEAVGLFLKTMASFACITGVMVLVWISLSTLL